MAHTRTQEYLLNTLELRHPRDDITTTPFSWIRSFPSDYNLLLPLKGGRVIWPRVPRSSHKCIKSKSNMNESGRSRPTAASKLTLDQQSTARLEIDPPRHLLPHATPCPVHVPSSSSAQGVPPFPFPIIHTYKLPLPTVHTYRLTPDEPPTSFLVRSCICQDLPAIQP
jgi:hypothetical protein